MNMINVNNYEEAYDELLRLANDAYDIGDLSNWKSLNQEAEKLRKWLSNGKQPPCPVNLNLFGVTVKREDSVGKGETDKELKKPEIIDQSVTIVSGQAKSDLENFDDSTITVETETHPGIPQAEQGLFPVGIEDVTEVQTATVLETPEQAALRRQLKDAEDYLAEDKYREALNLGKMIKDHADPGELKNAAADIVDRANNQLSERLRDALTKGDEARGSGNQEEARKQYRIAQDLDPDNSHAINALIELNGVTEGGTDSRTEINRLRAGLKERKDIRIIGEAIYQVEARYKLGELIDDDLIDELSRARKYFDELRAEMGKETTMARFGNLEAKKEAWEKARQRLDQGFLYTYHSVIGKDVPTVEYVEETNRLFEEKSAETAQYELDVAKNSLPNHPEVAYDRLKKALEKPFLPQHFGELEEQFQVVEGLLNDKRKAEELIAEANGCDNPLQILNLVRTASEIFPYVSGIELRITQARQTAIDTLAAQMDAHFRRVDALLKMDSEQAFEEARDEVAKADKIANQFSEVEKPEKLQNLLVVGADWVKKINERQGLRSEFEKRVETIRQHMADPNRRVVGKQLFQDLRQDDRFADFSELRTLISEMDQYTDLSEQLAGARTAKERGNWERVYELAEKIKMGGKAGQFSAEVDNLFSQAGIELDIIRAQQFLRDRNIIEARMLINRIIRSAQTQTHKDVLKKRLSEEIVQIRKCQDDTPPMQELFDEAINTLGLSENPYVNLLLLHSLDPSQSYKSITNLSESDLKKILISLGKKSEEKVSIQEATDVAKKLLLDELKKKSIENRIKALLIFRHVQGNPIEQKADWPPYALSLKTTEAGSMARLIVDSLKQDLLEPLKAEYFNRTTNPLSDSSIKKMAKNSLLLREANLLESEDDREAARWFEVEQGSREAIEKQNDGEWDEAVKIWNDLKLRYPGVKDIQKNLDLALRKKEALDAVFSEVDEKVGHGQYLAGLRIIFNALNNTLTKGEPALKVKFDENRNKAENHYISIATEEGGKLNHESISKAVLALYELNEIEELCNIPQDERRSKKELNKLENWLKKIHPDLAAQFDQLGDLYRLLEEADALSADLYQVETNSEDHSSASTNKWDEAISKRNFKDLKAYWTQIDELGLDDNPMAIAFRQRLDGWERVFETISEKMNLISRKFIADEDFQGVLQELHMIKVKPENLSTLEQNEYDHIRMKMSQHMVILDSFSHKGENLIGWSAVENEAKQRQEEYETWKAWMDDSSSLIELAKSEIREFVVLSDDIPLSKHQEALENAIYKYINVIEFLQKTPSDTHSGFVRSNKVMDIKKKGQKVLSENLQYLDETMIKLEALIKQIEEKGGFPTQEEFKHAAVTVNRGDVSRLRKLCDHANLIGPGNSIISGRDLQFVKIQTGKGNFTPLLQLLDCLEILGIEGFSKTQAIENAITQRNQNDGEFLRIISSLDEGLSLLEVFRNAREKASQKNFDQLKDFLEYSRKMRSLRKKEEEDRLRLYERVIEQSKFSKQSIWDKIRQLFSF